MRAPQAMVSWRLLSGSVVALVTLTAIVSHYFGAATGAAALTLAAASMAIGYALTSRAPQQRPNLPEAPQPQGSTRLTVAIVDALDLPALILDADMRVLAHNHSVRELFPQITTGKGLQSFSRHPELLSAVQAAASQSMPRVVTITDRVPFGRLLLATVSPLRPDLQIDAPPGTTSAMLTFIQFRDLTEQDRLAQMRSDFIANASHELRTPLASLKGFIETLRGSARDDPAARQKFLGIMETQAARMARILDDLLSLSRIEMRVHLAPDGEVNISTLLQAIVQGLEPIARDANIVLSLDSGTAINHVRGDRDELEQVFQNLIHNAIKYGDHGGKVALQISRRSAGRATPERIAVSVTDNGPGIANKHLPRLTERFYRVDTATSRDRGGTGLGLAIVKHILVRHRGDLEITSVLGEGSTFTVLLDVLPDSATAQRAPGENTLVRPSTI